MTTYKIVLADDEPQILWGMKEGIDWSSFGFEIVGLASNGQEALDMVKSLRPDVLISDIKMPFIDGIQLAKEIYDEFIKIKVVLFSGFDDFEYAQKAIRYGVSEYLLKPIDTHDLEDLLKRLYQTIDEEIKEKINQDKLLNRYRESLPLLKEQFLINLLENKLEENQIQDGLHEFDITLEGPYYTVLMLQLNCSNNQVLQQLSALTLILDNIEQFCNYQLCNTYQYPVIILSFKREKDIENILKYLTEMNNHVRKVMEVGFYGGVGHLYQRINDISKAYQDAKRALEYSVVSKGDYFFYLNDIESVEIKEDYYFEENQISDLATAIKTKTIAEIQELNDCLFKTLDQHYSQFTQYQQYCLELYFYLSNIARQYKLSENKLLDTKENINILLSLSTLDQLVDWLLEFSASLNQLIKQKRVDTNSLLAQKAKDYIDRNFSDSNLSVDTMCDYLHVSASHFSSIFKKEHQVSFVNYLTDKRINEAIRLLQTTDYKTRVISEMVGYPESNYFSYVFKKKMNVSPIQFRKMKGSRDDK